jgi:hypothetical protein
MIYDIKTKIKDVYKQSNFWVITLDNGMKFMHNGWQGPAPKVGDSCRVYIEPEDSDGGEDETDG